MWPFSGSKRSRVFRHVMLLQELEQRIVLDAAVADQQHQTDSVDHAATIEVAGQSATPGPAQPVVQAPQTAGQTAPEAALPHQAADGQPLNVILVSNAVADVAAISHAAKDNAQVIVFDHAQDNLSTVVAKLDNLAQSTGHQIGTIAIVDHGGAGYFDVGSDVINVHNLWAYEAKFQSLRHDLASGAQIQFYACDTAGNILGKDLVDSIAFYTGANVFASVDDTGGSHGNWTLEYSAGTGALFHSIIDSGTLSSQQADLGGNPGEPMTTWFHGSGGFTGWDIYNYATGVYYTKDYQVFWQHVDTGGEWKYFNGASWAHTDNLGHAPFDGGYAQAATWFHATSGTYNGYDAYIGKGVTYFSLNHSAIGATFWQHADTGAWSYYDGSAWNPTANFRVEPMNVWFHGYLHPGWETYDTTGKSYYTHDYTTFWQHTTSPAAWTYYNGSGWASTDNLGDVQYDTGLYGTPNNWFHATSGTYNGYDVYIGTGVTYFSLNHTATGATFWQHADTGAWSYYDASAWNPAPGFLQEPLNVWFHGYSSDAGWETYNASGVSFYTHDYTHFWQIVIGTGEWKYYDTKLWTHSDARGHAQYDSGLYATPNTWFHATSGTYNGYDVYIGDGSAFFSPNHSATGATLWQHTSADAWSYYDGSAWNLTANFNVEPMNVWFHGYGADAGWDTYNYSGGSYYTHDYVHFWNMASGTAATLVKDIYPGSIDSNPYHLTNVNGNLLFLAYGPDSNLGLWKSNGTDAGTTLVKYINPSGTGYDTISHKMAAMNGALYFVAGTDTYGPELWKTDGSSTVIVKDILTGFGGSDPDNLTIVGNTLYFTAFSGTSGHEELWKSDGTTAGTMFVKDIGYGSVTCNPGNLTSINSTLYFTATDGAQGIALWRSDGTTGGTVIVKVLDPGAWWGFYNPVELTSVNNRLYFVMCDDTHGSELWTSDGTTGGSGMLKDIRPGTGSSSPAHLTNVNGSLYFSASDSLSGNELWTSDGTAAGTVMVKDIRPGSSSSNPDWLTNVNGTLYFTAYDGSGYSLWRSNGTAAGTSSVPVAGLSGSINLTNVNGTLYFDHGSELWKSDGSAAGTFMLTNSVVPYEVFSCNGTAYLTADDITHGKELFKLSSVTTWSYYNGSSWRTVSGLGAT